MRTIMRGKDTDKKWLGECEHCGSILEAVTCELKVTSGDYLSDYEDSAWTDCPECQKANSVCFHKEGTATAKGVIATALQKSITG